MSDYAVREDRAVGAEQGDGIPGGAEPCAHSECPRGGELNAAVTSALVGIHHRYLGRGPNTASTFHHGNVVVTLMHDVLTHAEKSLIDSHRADVVHQTRHLLHETMDADFREAIERLTGRRVITSISGNNVESNVATEMFILDEPA